jgi:UDP-3-O-[3-hydroxymyristoyl] glucosamine N-acyltransferase
MKFSQPQALTDLVKIIGGEIIGDSMTTILGINDIGSAMPGELIFADSEKYIAIGLAGKASAIIVPVKLDFKTSQLNGKALVRVDHPHEALNRIAIAMFGGMDSAPVSGIHSTALIAKSARIPKNCSVGPYCSVGENTTIGEGTVLVSHVVIEENCRIGTRCRIGSHSTVYRRSIIGDDVVIGSGCSIGATAFYFYRTGQELKGGNAFGAVELASRVELGAGCTIDRGISRNTLIDEDSKFDNQVHIGHDTRIGKRVVIAAQAGIAGYVEVGDDVVVRGQVGIMQHVKVGKSSELLGKSGIDQDVAENQTVFGIPALTRERYAQRRRALRKRIRRLERDAELALGKQREFQARVFQAIADESGKEVSEISLEQSLGGDLEFDSLDRVELQMALEEEFDLELLELELDESEFENVKTVGNVVELVRKSLRIKSKTP